MIESVLASDGSKTVSIGSAEGVACEDAEVIEAAGGDSRLVPSGRSDIRMGPSLCETFDGPLSGPAVVACLPGFVVLADFSAFAGRRFGQSGCVRAAPDTLGCGFGKGLLFFTASWTMCGAQRV